MVNELHGNGNRSEHESSRADDLVATLIQAAGRRENPPADAYEAALEVATIAWQDKIRQRRNRKRVYWASAASVIAAITIAWFVNMAPVDEIQQIASMERIIGTAEVRTEGDAGWSVLHNEDQRLSGGDWLRTADGSYAGILLDNGISLRIADKTEIMIASASRIELLSGKIYLATGADNDTPHQVEVVTPAGTVWDVGTQFEVVYHSDGYRLRVREGSVIMDRGDEEIETEAGNQTAIDADGDISSARISPDDPDWKWTETVAPALDIEGKSVTDLVTWVSRETGRSIRYSSKGVEKKANSTVLHGNVRHLAPMDALSVMLATTDFEHIVERDGTILIRAKSIL